MEAFSDQEIVVTGLTTSPLAVRVHAVAIDGWTRAEANSNIALEPQVVAAGELEGVEPGQQDLLSRVIVPVAEDGRVRGATVRVRHFVLDLLVVLHGFGRTASGESAVNVVRLDFHFEHQVITDLGAADLASVRRANGHEASGRRSRVGDGTGSGDHANVKAQGDGLLAGVVHALDVVGPGLESDQFGMFLDDQDERGLSVNVYQSAGAELNLEVDDLSFAATDDSSALRILAVSLDVEDAVEAV